MTERWLIARAMTNTLVTAVRNTLMLESWEGRRMDSQVILVPLDGSSLSEAALPYAVALGSAMGCSLRILCVVEQVFEDLPTERDKLAAALERAQVANTRAYLARVVRRLHSAGVQARTRLVRGTATAEILAAAQGADVALIVMATHGRSGVGRFVLGSVADKVMRLSNRPTLLMHPHAAGEAPAVQLRHLAVPLDGSPLAETALQQAANLARATGAKLTLLRVIPSLRETMDWGSEYVPELTDIEAEMGADARESLEAVRCRLPAGIESETVVLCGPTGPTLADYVRGNAVDLTIMTTHGRSGFSRVVLGSTADQLLQTGLPVLLVRTPELEAAGPEAGAVIVPQPVTSQ
jgi:nucleotide-binding universal stress UspA family protein